MNSSAARPPNIAAEGRAKSIVPSWRRLGASVIPHDAAAILAGLLAAPFLLIFALGIAIIKAARASLGK